MTLAVNSEGVARVRVKQGFFAVLRISKIDAFVAKLARDGAVHLLVPSAPHTCLLNFSAYCAGADRDACVVQGQIHQFVLRLLQVCTVIVFALTF